MIRPYSHSLSDDETMYRPPAEREADAARDPVTVFPKWLYDTIEDLPDLLVVVQLERVRGHHELHTVDIQLDKTVGSFVPSLDHAPAEEADHPEHAGAAQQ